MSGPWTINSSLKENKLPFVKTQKRLSLLQLLLYTPFQTDVCVFLPNCGHWTAAMSRDFHHWSHCERPVPPTSRTLRSPRSAFSSTERGNKRKKTNKTDIHSVWSKNAARCEWTDECQRAAQSAACDLFRHLLIYFTLRTTEAFKTAGEVAQAVLEDTTALCL